MWSSMAGLIPGVVQITSGNLCGKCHREFSVTRNRFMGWLTAIKFCPFCGYDLVGNTEALLRSEGYVMDDTK